MCRSLVEGGESLRVADVLKQQHAVAIGFCVFFLCGLGFGFGLGGVFCLFGWGFFLLSFH